MIFLGDGVLYKALSLFLLCLIGKEVFMNQYDYEGPVMEFDRCISNNWKGTTFAPTEKKAKSNLAYQYKKEAWQNCIYKNIASR